MGPQVRREAREQAGKPDLDAALEKQVRLLTWMKYFQCGVCIYYAS